MWPPLLAMVLPITATLAKSGDSPFESDSLRRIENSTDLHKNSDTDRLPLLHGTLALRLGVPETLRNTHNITIVTTVFNTGNKTLTIVNDPEGLLSAHTKHIEFYEQSTTEPGGLIRAYSVYSPYDDQPKEKYGLQNYTILEPGEHKSVAHDLSGMYTFHRAGPHVVWVAAKAGWFRIMENNTAVAFAKGKMINDPRAGNAAVINIDESVIDPSSTDIDTSLSADLRPRTEQDGPWSYTPSRPKFTKCSPEQQDIITTTIDSANSMVHERIMFSSDRGDAARWHTVEKCFSNLKGELNEFRYSCECSEDSVNAFATSSEHGTINLCTKFWRVPRTRSSSRTGVLIGAARRFGKICGAHYLPGEYPENAEINSDKYHFFPENVTLPVA